MDRAEARAVLAPHLALFRQRSYSELRTLIGDVSVLEVLGPSGTEYQIEVEVFWDDPSAKVNLRIIGAIDDDRPTGATSPASDSFILAPDGTFVGE